MTQLPAPRFFVGAVIAGFLNCALIGIATAQSTNPGEIIIRYQGTGDSIPPPHREGDVYVIAIPRALAPQPERLVAPFVNEIVGENEVWRFALADNAAVAVEELRNGSIRVRLGGEQLSKLNAPASVTRTSLISTAAAPAEAALPVAAEPAPQINANGTLLVATMRAAPDASSSEAGDAGNLAANGAGRALKLSEAGVDLSVPQSPAFAILGITPDNVIQPSSPRALALSLLNGVGKDGAFQSGIAIDTVPYLLLSGSSKTLRDYQDSYAVRFLSRTQFSFATSKGAQDTDPSLKLALGLHMTLFDNGDPRLDREFINDLGKAFFALGYIDPEDPAAVADANRRWKTITDEARTNARKRNWNKSSWSLGLAPSWIDKTGNSGHYDWNGGAAWTSLAYGFDTEPFTNTGLDETSQLILHLRYRNHEEVPDPMTTGSFYTEDNFQAVLRLRIGSPEFNASLDGAYVREWNSGAHDGSSYRLAFILERKMAANLWFRLSYGKEFDTPDGKDASLFLGSFHLGASEDSSPVQAARR
jgi:hypothetical protein